MRKGSENLLVYPYGIGGGGPECPLGRSEAGGAAGESSWTDGRGTRDDGTGTPTSADALGADIIYATVWGTVVQGWAQGRARDALSRVV